MQKKLKEIVFLIVGLMSFGVAAQQLQLTPPAAGGGLPAAAPPPKAPDKGELNTAVGVYYGYTITNTLITRLGLDPKTDVDFKVIVEALSSYVAGKPGVMTVPEANKILTEQSEYQKAVALEAVKKMNENAPHFKEASEKFITSLEGQPGLTKLASGVLYKVIKDGTNDSPGPNDNALVTLKGTRADGTEVLAIEHHSIPLTATVISPGLSQALQLMKVGAHWMVYLPYAQAFDDKPQFPDPKLGYKLPPYSALIFDVQLEGVQHRPAPAPAPVNSAVAPSPNVASSQIVRVPSAEEMNKGEQPRVLSDDEVKAEQRKAMENAARSNAAAGMSNNAPK